MLQKRQFLLGLFVLILTISFINTNSSKSSSPPPFVLILTISFINAMPYATLTGDGVSFNLNYKFYKPCILFSSSICIFSFNLNYKFYKLLYMASRIFPVTVLILTISFINSSISQITRLN